MSELEQLLPGRLHELADDLAPAGDLAGRATAARTRHHRQRRQRIGLTAVGVAVLAVVVGVPTAIGSLTRASGGHVATPGTASAPASAASASAEAQARAEREALAEARMAAAAAAAESAAHPTPMGGMRIDPAAQAVVDAEEARGVDELARAITRLTSPVRLGAAPASPACPEGAAALSQGLGVHVAYEQGDLTRGRDGCQWSTDGDAPTASQFEDRLTVGIGHVAQPVDTLLSRQRQLNELAMPGRCEMASVVAVDPDAVLERCAGAGAITWYLYLPDTTRTGTWVLGAVVGDRVAGHDGGADLVQAAALATANWPG